MTSESDLDGMVEKLACSPTELMLLDNHSFDKHTKNPSLGQEMGTEAK